MPWAEKGRVMAWMRHYEGVLRGRVHSRSVADKKKEGRPGIVEPVLRTGHAHFNMPPLMSTKLVNSSGQGVHQPPAYDLKEHTKDDAGPLCDSR